MGYREFADEDGQEWVVWDVLPAPRMATGRPAGGRPTVAVERAAGHVSPGWENGWLAFQSGPVSRRLRPIPPDWEEVSDSELRRLLQQATSVEQRATASQQQNDG